MEGSALLITYKCGHSFIEDKIEVKETSFIFKDGTPLYPFQNEDVALAESANFRVLINDDPGLGKTLTGLAIALKNKLFPCLVVCKAALRTQWVVEIHNRTGIISQLIKNGKDGPLDFFPIHIISYDSLRNAKWIDEGEYKPKLIILDECQAIKNIDSKRTRALQGLIREVSNQTKPRTFNVDLAKREKIKTMAQDLMRHHGLVDRFELFFEDIGKDRLGLCECRAVADGIIKGRITVSQSHAEKDSEDDVLDTILHEIAHAITPGAGHRPIWSECAKSIGGSGNAVAWCEGTIAIEENVATHTGIIALSATPIKNNAKEYFPILNILQPKRFAYESHYLNRYVDMYNSGYYAKYGGLRRNSTFFSDTADFIIRHRREDVLKDLPKLRRGHKFFPLGDDVARAYAALSGEFQKFYDENEESIGSQENQACILAFLNKMRHLTGYSKVDPTFELAQEFLEADESRKLTIFHHHIDVGDMLTAKFRSIGVEPLRFWAEDPERGRKIGQCATSHWPSTDPKDRILIASTLASGEGLNLQACSDAYIMERQWNPANEEQAEGRFIRIGSEASFVDITYVTATKTIDEFMIDLVERKRENVSFTLNKGQNVSVYNEQSIIRDLAALIARENRKRWSV